MPVLSQMQVKTLAQAKPGELLAIPDQAGRATFCFLLDQNSGTNLLGIIRSSNEAKATPYVTVTDGSLAVLSYGLGWVFEPVTLTEKSTFPYIGNGFTGSGAFFIGDRAMFRFAAVPEANLSDPFAIDLADGSIVDQMPIGSKVSISEWKLWAHADDRTHRHGEPVLTLPAKPSPARS